MAATTFSVSGGLLSRNSLLERLNTKRWTVRVEKDPRCTSSGAVPQKDPRSTLAVPGAVLTLVDDVLARLAVGVLPNHEARHAVVGDLEQNRARSTPEHTCGGWVGGTEQNKSWDTQKIRLAVTKDGIHKCVGTYFHRIHVVCVRVCVCVFTV